MPISDDVDIAAWTHLVVRSDFPANNLQEVIAVLKANPGKYNFASPGVGTTQHFAVELFSQMAGVKMEHIPFRGTPAAITALLGKQVDLMVELIQTVRGYVETGELKAIAVTSPQRFPSVLNVPTFAESGLPGYAVTSWYGLACPHADADRREVTKALLQTLNARRLGRYSQIRRAQSLDGCANYEATAWQQVRRAGIAQRRKITAIPMICLWTVGS